MNVRAVLGMLALGALLLPACSKAGRSRSASPPPRQDDSAGGKVEVELSDSTWSDRADFHGLQVQIAPLAERIRKTDYQMPFLVRLRNKTGKPITFLSPAPFPVFHGEIAVRGPDGNNIILRQGCKKKHVMEDVAFEPEEMKEFRRNALGQCGCKCAGLGDLTPGVYTVQLARSNTIKIHVTE